MMTSHRLHNPFLKKSKCLRIRPKFASCLFPCLVCCAMLRRLSTFSVVGLAFAMTLSLLLYPLGLGYIKRSALNLNLFLSKSLTLLKYLS